MPTNYEKIMAILEDERQKELKCANMSKELMRKTLNPIHRIQLKKGSTDLWIMFSALIWQSTASAEKRRTGSNKGPFSLREKYTFPYEETQKIFRRFYTMKKQKWTEKPITWGGYLKLAGVCSIISLMMSACYMVVVFNIHPIKSIKEAIHRRFSKETAEK